MMVGAARTSRSQTNLATPVSRWISDACPARFTTAQVGSRMQLTGAQLAAAYRPNHSDQAAADASLCCMGCPTRGGRAKKTWLWHCAALSRSWHLHGERLSHATRSICARMRTNSCAHDHELALLFLLVPTTMVLYSRKYLCPRRTGAPKPLRRGTQYNSSPDKKALLFRLQLYRAAPRARRTRLTVSRHPENRGKNRGAIPAWLCDVVCCV